MNHCRLIIEYFYELYFDINQLYYEYINNDGYYEYWNYL